MSGFTVDRLHIKRQESGANYLLIDGRTGSTLAKVGWLSLDGTPFAFGDAPAELEFGGTSTKHFELQGLDTDEKPPRAAGARLTLTGD